MKNAKIQAAGGDTQETMNKKKTWKEVTPENVRFDYDMYKLYFDEIGPAIVGSKNHKQKSCLVVPEEWMTVAEESLGFLALENYSLKVRANVDNQPPPPDMKYTLSGSAKRNQGINKAGIQRYNAIFDTIKEQRAANDQCGKKYLQENKTKYTNKKECIAANVEERAKKRQKGLDEVRCIELPEELLATITEV